MKELKSSGLERLNSLEESDKLALLSSTPPFKKYLYEHKDLAHFFQSTTFQNQLVIASILAIGEGPTVFREARLESPSFKELLDHLWTVEIFYHEIGGIVGYHKTVLELLEGKQSIKDTSVRLLKPTGVDLTDPNTDLATLVRQGIEALPDMAEMYPIGGAGDRLDLHHPKTGEALPAAELFFCGRSLLALLVRDLQAKEYLYYKLKGDQLQTPVAMMTSEEKNNHQHIIEICERNNWFGRPKESFFLFRQPLVPVITKEGHWAMTAPMTIKIKPGGHGIIWKLALNAGVFDWFRTHNRKKLLLRQINNPIAGTDSGILTLCGIGCQSNKAFGFSSCPRLLNTAQGMLVLKEKKDEAGYHYGISNIEYTDFAKRGLEDLPSSPESRYSKYPANTNILFADIETVKSLIPHHPIPGMLVNFKNEVTCIDSEGKSHSIKAGRLESTMQNISDFIVEKADHPLNQKELLEAKTFVIYNKRRKTISVTKKSWQKGKPLLETPPGAYFELLQNNHELFSTHCGIDLPEFSTQESYIEKGPNLIIFFHPALGPLYSIISQKIRGGRLQEGSELQLEIAEFRSENLDLDGSLLIKAEFPLGHVGKSQETIYSERSGKCVLKNVTVKNQGIDRSKENVYWMNQIARKQKCEIVLKGSGEFIAENVTFYGDLFIEVPDGYRWTAEQQGDSLTFKKEKIDKPSWFWTYSFQEDNSIRLN